MFMNIETVDLNLSRHSESDCLVDEFEDNEHYGQGVSHYADKAETLYAKLS